MPPLRGSGFRMHWVYNNATPSGLKEIRLVRKGGEIDGGDIMIHRYHLDAILYEDIETQLNNANASKLPFEVNLEVDNRILDFVNENDKGLYLITYDPEDDGGSILVVLNYTKMELTILMS